MGDKCNCYRFSPRDSLSGAVAQIADYLSKHPGWNETELRAFVDGLISSAGVESFNGRSGNVTLNKDDVNNLLIANCYFAEANETIESIDVLALYKLGIRIVFTQYSSEIGGYTLAYGIEYYPATDTAKAYLFSSGSGGGTGAIVSVNGKTGVVVLKAGDILMNNGDSVEYAVSNAKAIANAAYSPDNPPPYPVNSINSKTGSVMLKVVDVSNGDPVDDNAYIFIDETENYPDIIAPDSNKLGGQIPSYYATAESVNSLKNDMVKYRTAVNLLDNSDFEIAQAGYGGKHGSTVYAADRWMQDDTTERTYTYTTKNGHGALKCSTDTRIQQKLHLVDGQNYTAAFYINNTLYILNFTANGATNGSGAIWVNKQSDGTYMFIVSNIPAGGIVSEPVLYIGAYTAETLPQYVPKGYAAEQMACRWTYIPFVQNAFLGYALTDPDGINFQGFIPLPKMRVANPQIQGGLASWDGNTSIAVASITKGIWQGNGLRLNGALNSASTPKTTIAIYASTSGAFIADL